MMTMKLMAAVAALVIGTSSVDAKQSSSTYFETVPVTQGMQVQTVGKKVVCSRDNAGRVVSKTIYRWDAAADCWVPSSEYKASYGHRRNTLTYSRWCQASQSFKVIATQDYDTTVANII